MQPPVLLKPIPTQIVNERAAYGPFDLKEFIQSPDKTKLLFVAELKSGEALPRGMICTNDGFLTGIPGKSTEGNYEILVTAENEAGAVQATVAFIIKPSPTDSGIAYNDKLKKHVYHLLC